MSLESLRQMRRAGERPSGVLKVVVGKRNPAIEGDADVISILPSDEPAVMDWRAVVGLPLALFVCDGFTPLAEKTFDAVVAAKCKPCGAVWRDATVTVDEPSKPALRRMWEVLCL